MSVAFWPGTSQRRDLHAVDDQPDDDRADQRADERADDAAPEAVGQEDREVPDGQAHHHPGEQAHQPPPVALVARSFAFLRGVSASFLEHEILRRQIGGRIALRGWAARSARLGACGTAGGACCATPARPAPRRLRSRSALDVEVAHQFLELVAGDLLAGLLRCDQAAAPRCVCASGRARRPSGAPPTVVA